jgi:hypothetical protein
MNFHHNRILLRMHYIKINDVFVANGFLNSGGWNILYKTDSAYCYYCRHFHNGTNMNSRVRNAYSINTSHELDTLIDINKRLYSIDYLP